MAVAQPRQSNLAPSFGLIQEGLSQRASLESKRAPGTGKSIAGAIAKTAERITGTILEKKIEARFKDRGKIEINEKMARDIEKKLELPEGSMSDSIGKKADPLELAEFMGNLRFKIQEQEDKEEKQEALRVKEQGAREAVEAGVKEGILTPREELISKLPGGFESLARGLSKQPAKKSSQFVGTSGDQAVLFQPDQDSFKTVPLPGETELEPKIKPTLPASKAEALAGISNTLTQLRKAKKLFDPKFTGLLDVKLGAAREKGIGPGRLIGKDVKPLPNETEFRTLMLRDINNQIKQITGAQLSEAEAERILKSLPTLDLEDSAFKRRLDETIKITDSIFKSKEESFTKAGFRGFKARPQESGGPKILSIRKK